MTSAEFERNPRLASKHMSASVPPNDLVANLVATKWVKLNVGGRPFVVLRQTLERMEYFKNLFSNLRFQFDRDETGAILLDRDGDLFAQVLQIVRTESIPITASAALLNELLSYGVDISNYKLQEFELLSLRIKFRPVPRGRELCTTPTWMFATCRPSSPEMTFDYYPTGLGDHPLSIEEYPLEVIIAAVEKDGFRLVTIDLTLLRELTLESTNYNNDIFSSVMNEASFRSVIALFKRDWVQGSMLIKQSQIEDNN